MQKYFCKTLTCCLLCNHINHFDLHASCVRLRYASSAAHWPFRQQTWGRFHSFLLLRNLSYRQRRENVNLQARTGLRTDLSQAPADQAAVPLGRSHLCHAARNTGPENVVQDQPGIRPCRVD